MRVCVFSDVHGNGQAFEVARKEFVAKGADLYIFLGDLCGYYYDQIQIFDGLRSIDNLIALGGNHDAMFLEIEAGNQNLRDQYRRQYGHSMEHLLDEVHHPDLADWLRRRSLSHTSICQAFACFHGSPLDPLDGYVYPDTALKPFADIRERFVFLGHTHHKMHRIHDGIHFVNPGSLGQPRDGSPPTYAMVETCASKVTFHEVDYDKATLRKQIRARGDAKTYLETILDR